LQQARDSLAAHHKAHGTTDTNKQEREERERLKRTQERQNELLLDEMRDIEEQIRQYRLRMRFLQKRYENETITMGELAERQDALKKIGQLEDQRTRLEVLTRPILLQREMQKQEDRLAVLVRNMNDMERTIARTDQMILRTSDPSEIRDLEEVNEYDRKKLADIDDERRLLAKKYEENKRQLGINSRIASQHIGRRHPASSLERKMKNFYI
jgi:hypothetical protein